MTGNQFDTRPMDYESSLDRLRTTQFGRISVLHKGMPLVLPVTFRLVEDHLAIPTVDTDDAVRLTRDRIVAFEADVLSADGGWSVNVMGFATATEPESVRKANGGWVGGAHQNGFVPWKELRGVDIALDLVIGRLIVPRPTTADPRAETPVLAMDPGLGARITS